MSDTVEIIDEGMIGGNFVRFFLDNVSYYPTEKIVRMVAINIYGIDLSKDGLMDSEKWCNENAGKAGTRPVNLSRPLAHCDVEGEFILFLPVNELVWGLMDIKRVFPFPMRPDINLSIISPVALMPHPLHITAGGVYSQKSSFSVVDQDGSTWTLHCK